MKPTNKQTYKHRECKKYTIVDVESYFLYWPVSFQKVCKKIHIYQHIFV